MLVGNIFVWRRIPLDVTLSTGNVVAMRIATYDEVKSLQKGQPITGISGTVEYVGKCETKDGNYGPYSTQRIAVKMPGGELSIRLMNHDTVDASAKGKRVWIIQGQDKKGQWGGIKADHYQQTQGDRAGQIRYGADVNGVAEICWAEPGTSAPTQGAPSAPAAQPAARQSPAPAQRPAGTMDLRGVKLSAGTDMIASDICIKAAIQVIKANSAAISEVCGEPPTPRDVLALAMGYFIQGQRESRFTGLGSNWSAYLNGAAPAQRPAATPPPQPEPAPFQQEHLPSDNDGAPPPGDGDDVPF